MAGHSRQFTPGGLPDNCETHCVSGNRTHDLPIMSPARYQLCHRDHRFRVYDVGCRLVSLVVTAAQIKYQMKTNDAKTATNTPLCEKRAVGEKFVITIQIIVRTRRMMSLMRQLFSLPILKQDA